MGRLGVARELWMFLIGSKKFWLMPVMALLIMLGGLLVMAGGSALAPFIYTLF